MGWKRISHTVAGGLVCAALGCSSQAVEDSAYQDGPLPARLAELFSVEEAPFAYYQAVSQTQEDGSTAYFRADQIPLLETVEYPGPGIQSNDAANIATTKLVLVPLDEGRAPIDEANKASRLHRELVGDKMTLDATITAGTADWDIFASSWWPQSSNGIAQRWTPGIPYDQRTNFSNVADRDNLSPAEKYDLLFSDGLCNGQPCTVAQVENCAYREWVDDPDNCHKITNAAHQVAGPATKWELENHGNWQRFRPEGWWGHCNGWASYATAEMLGAPTRDIWVKRVGSDDVVQCPADPNNTDPDCMLVRMADIEALMTELYFSDSATFSGRRCNVPPGEEERDEFNRSAEPECWDINPGTLHVALSRLMGDGQGASPLADASAPAQRLPFIIDHAWDYQVWNFPIKKFEVTSIERITEQAATLALCSEGNYAQCNAAGGYPFNPDATQFARVTLKYWMVSDGVSGGALLTPASDRNVPLHETELNYILELDNLDTVLGGEWIYNPETHVNNKTLHPDFLWAAVNNEGSMYGWTNDDLSDRDNAHIRYSKVKMLLEWATAEETPPPPVEPTGTSCKSCSWTRVNTECQCDQACTLHGDCCTDNAGTFGYASDYSDAWRAEVGCDG